ncbi:hypothetical protein EHS25_008457 [Saitozyma podzolica]|uniref:GTP-binding protein of the rab/ypt n=1 Tax=Saitozyma podzolica TaxID=1890683 RepID=A0A427YPK7_9TREE|nr:hypothetical protein EHS25_008457 [Saitozyma podzolica]
MWHRTPQLRPRPVVVVSMRLDSFSYSLNPPFSILNVNGSHSIPIRTPTLGRNRPSIDSPRLTAASIVAATGHRRTSTVHRRRLIGPHRLHRYRRGRRDRPYDPRFQLFQPLHDIPGGPWLPRRHPLENRIVKFEIWDTAGQGPSFFANSERFHSLAPMYYRNAQAAVVVYDITKAASLEKAKAWVKELQRQASPNIVIALVGNKVRVPISLTSNIIDPYQLDLVGDASTTASTEAPASAEEEDEEREPSSDAEDESPASPAEPAAADSDNLRQVSTAEAEAYAKEARLLFFEASAKTGQNVGEVFTEIAKTIPLDVISPKPAQGQARRSAGGNGQGQDGANVSLGEGQQAKKGGCC